MVDYKKLWDVMKKQKMTKTELRVAAGLSSSTFAKLSKNEMVALDVLVRICRVLKCQLSDICFVSFEEGEKHYE